MEIKREILTELAVKTIKGTSFASVRNYTNKEGEIANYTFIIGFDYNCMKEKDIETLEKLSNFDSKELSSFDKQIILEAKESILKGLKTPNKNISEAQKNSYDHICKGLKVHKETGKLYIDGLLMRKTVIKKAEKEKKATNSKDLTKVKDIIKKLADLRMAKYRSFSVGDFKELRIKGLKIS